MVKVILKFWLDNGDIGLSNINGLIRIRFMDDDDFYPMTNRIDITSSKTLMLIAVR